MKSDQGKQGILFRSLWQRLCGCRDFTGGPVVKNLLCDVGDMGLDPWLGIPHAVKKLERCAPEQKILHAATKTWYSQINK